MKKRAYLTIDDSPSRHFRERVELLQRKHIIAVWFCLGENLMQRRDEVIHAIRAGQIIANHTWDHPHFSEIDFEEGKDQIARTDSLIEELYAAAGLDRKHKLFRFPYFDRGGKFAAQYQSYLRQQGYSHPEWTDVSYQYFDEYREAVDWPATLDCMEWVYGSRHEKEYGLSSMIDIQHRILADDPEHGLGFYTDSADIILIHDHEKPDDRFATLIEFFIERGVDFIDPTRVD
jgi:peptidoglycan/xylan/chitin deacetylase (PgdA/CDA1 family)